jgi:hypothetical protein
MADTMSPQSLLILQVYFVTIDMGLVFHGEASELVS